MGKRGHWDPMGAEEEDRVRGNGVTETFFERHDGRWSCGTCLLTQH